MSAYLRMLLLDRLAAFKPGSYAKEKQSKFVAVLKVVGLALLILYLYGTVVFLEYMMFRMLNGIGQGQAVLGFALLASTLLYLIAGFFHINGLLFFGKDTNFLAGMPLTSRSILTGKMLMVMVENALESLLICAPVIILYGLSSGAGFAYYLKSVLVFAVVPVLPLTVGMILSFLLIRISRLWKRREGMTTILALGLFIGIVVGEMSLMKVSEEEITQWLLSLLIGRGSLTSILLQKMPWLQWALDGMVTAGAAGWLKLGLFVLVSLVIAALAVWLLGGSYMKLAVRQAEAIGQVNRGKKRSLGKEGERSPKIALLWQEVRDVLTIPVYATNCLIGMIAMPLMLVVMAVAAGEGIDFVDLSGALKLVPKGAYLAVATAVFATLGMMGQAPSTSVSREGKCHELRKTYPVSGRVQLHAKVNMGVVFHMVGAVLLLVIACVLLPNFWQQNVLAFLCVLPFAYLYSLAGVLMDALHPKLDWKTETQAVKENFSVLLCMLVALALTALLVGAFILLMKWGLGWYVSFVAVLLLTILLDGLLLFWLDRGGEKSYYAH